MSRQTQVVLLLILTIAATAFADAEKPLPADDLDLHVNETAEHYQAKPSCPRGWRLYSRRCFKYQSTKTEWALAEKYCLGGHLVSIHNENEYQWVKALIRSHDYKESPTWIGLSACQQKFKWFWSDASRVTFTRWNKREPNYLFGECCVNINFGKDKNWNDIKCKKKYPFVCTRRL